MSNANDYPTMCRLYRELHLFTHSGLVEPPGTPRSVENPDVVPVEWPGLGKFELTKGQSLVVNELLRSLMNFFRHEVPEQHLVHVSGEDVSRLSGVFRGSPAWGTLVVKGETPGTFRLARLPSAPDSAE